MNRAFKYGDGFFETIRTVNAYVPFLEQHLQRIKEAIDIFEFHNETELTTNWLLALIDPENSPNHTIRITFYRDGEGKYAPINNSFITEIETSSNETKFWLPAKLDLHSELQQAPSAIGSIGIYEIPKPMHPIFTVKTLSSAFYVIASKHQVEEQLDYLLLTDSQGSIIEEVRHNILCIKGDDIIVPPKDAGFVYGACLRFLNPLYGFQMESRPIQAGEIETFDAIFLCNSVSGVKRVQ